MSGKSFAAVMAVLGVIGLLGFGVLAKGERALNVGDTAPVAELELLTAPTTEGQASQDGEDAEEGETASIADYAGQWVLVNAWASWCLPCEDEAPDLAAFQSEHAEDGAFTILGVNTQDATDDALAFEDEFGINYPSVRDGSGDYAEELGSIGLPDTVLVDPDGQVAYVRRGQITTELLREQVLPLIGEDGPEGGKGEGTQ